MREIELFIGGREVDIDNDVNIPFNYAFTDMTNPTAVKNSFTKNVTIKGTAGNNKIFGHYFQADRRVGDGAVNIGADFDPMKRVDFQLRRNGDIIESGYCKLSGVTRKGNDVTYSLTLYGGLGDFLYNLSHSDEEGNKPTLASLYYKVKDDKGRLIGKDDELSFRISKEAVKEAWGNLGSDGERIWNFINFVPCYNGQPKDFDNNKAIIKINGNKYWDSYVNSGDFAPKNGYAVAELATAHDEWETGDLRSYLQRPAVKLSKVMGAISDPDNNGGYTVNWDGSFANNDNPYWADTWIALGQLDTDGDGNDVEMEGTMSYDRIDFDMVKRSTQWITFTDVNGEKLNDDDGYIDVSDLSEGSKFGGDTIYMKLKCSSNDTLFLCDYTRRLTTNLNDYCTLPVRFIVDDVETQQLISGYIPFSPWSDWADAHQPWFDGYDAQVYSNLTKVRAKFTGGEMTDMNGNELLYQFMIKDIIAVTKSKRIRIGFEIGTTNVKSIYLFTSRLVADTRVKEVDIWCEQVKPIATDPKFTISADGISSGARITKSLLFGDGTPADYFLSYIKTFGLVLQKDKNSKTIRVMTKNTFYKEQTVNIDDMIARDKENIITPNSLDSRYLTMKNETPETYLSTKYEKNNKRGYGELRLDTGWQFDSSEKDITDGLIFQNAVMGKDKSVYYINVPWVKSSYPTYANDQMTVTIYNKDERDEEKNKTVDIPPFGICPDGSYMVTLDAISKPCCYEMDGSDKSPVEISDFMLFYNGRTTNQRQVTDDFGDMYKLNGKRCWFWTNDPADPNVLTVNLPDFSRYTADGQYSLDFGTPKDTYGGQSINDKSSIYSRFWKNYLTDLYNRNTKTVDCYVVIPPYTDIKEWMRSFFWFDNALWTLNKVTDYDQTSYLPVRCQFVKVLSKADYTGGQSLQNI